MTRLALQDTMPVSVYRCPICDIVVETVIVGNWTPASEPAELSQSEQLESRTYSRECRHCIKGGAQARENVNGSGHHSATNAARHFGCVNKFRGYFGAFRSRTAKQSHSRSHKGQTRSVKVDCLAENSVKEQHTAAQAHQDIPFRFKNILWHLRQVSRLGTFSKFLNTTPPPFESCTMGRLAGDQCRKPSLLVRGSSGRGVAWHMKAGELITPIILTFSALLLWAVAL